MIEKSIWVDLETTGLVPGRHGVIQLAGRVYLAGTETVRFDYRIRPFPKDEIDDDALRVSGTTRDALACYMRPDEAYRSFISLLDRFVNRYDNRDKFFFWGYHADFDFGHLQEWFLKNGDPYSGAWFHWPPLDVSRYAMKALRRWRGYMQDFKLQTVARFYGIEVDPARLHDAQYDIELAWEVNRLVDAGAEPAGAAWLETMGV